MPTLVTVFPRRRSRPLAAVVATVIALTAAPALADPAYVLTKSIALGVPDRWDYAVFDAASGRAYFAHGDRVTVLDGRSGAIVGQVAGMPGGTHGIAFSPATGQGFTDDGGKGVAVAFDLKTLHVTKQIAADKDADAIVAEPMTGHVFVINGDSGTITVIDPTSDTAVATIAAGGKLEFAAADGAGMVYVAGAATKELMKIDARTNQIVARWSTPDCTSPHGLALDTKGNRAFMGCINKIMMVLDTTTGTIVAKLAIGRGSDAVAYDPTLRRVFSSNGGDGTITVYQQTSPDAYASLTPVTTTVSARTMAVDPATGRLFVLAADTDSATTPGGRPRIRPGSVKVMLFDPAR